MLFRSRDAVAQSSRDTAAAAAHDQVKIGRHARTGSAIVRRTVRTATQGDVAHDARDMQQVRQTAAMEARMGSLVQDAARRPLLAQRSRQGRRKARRRTVAASTRDASSVSQIIPVQVHG